MITYDRAKPCGFPSLCVLLAALTLSACGGGGGGGSNDPDVEDMTDFDVVIGTENDPTVTYPAFSDATAPINSDLRYISLNAALVGANGSATLDHDGGTITSGVLAGTLNSGRTSVALAGGGTGTLSNPDSNEFLRLFQIQGGANSGTIGVIGIETDPTDIPAPTVGTVEYGGTASVTAAPGDQNLYVLSGDVNVTADWATSTVTTRFGNFSGTANGNAAGSGLGQMIISGATIGADGSFTGGSITGTGTVFGSLSGTSGLSGTRGQFFGPDADEVGGVLVIDQGDFEGAGVYTAE